ncbi:CDP-glycerol glycerophosphotransferase [Bacilli bacterium PM5-3]|nr:CDP-glycerol glycerophosphotransferase [Bacilli bacterium PM5-3]MDH6603938.1 CDP-glycerol glycerophosphotransferase [Bacilli bacterium PM5-9]
MKKVFKKIKKVLSSTFLIKILNLITSITPIQKNLIIFESFFGVSISDNPLAIYENIDRSKYDCLFLVNDPKKYSDFKTVKRQTLKSYFLMRKAKVIINNSRMPKYWKKRDGQVYIQTWHGTPLKKLVHDLTTFNMPSANSLDDYLKLFDDDIKKWDYLISSCPYSTSCFKSAFQFEKEILEIGYPRNYKLYNYTTLDKESIKKKLNIPNDKRVVLYAPTYRDNQNNGLGEYYFNSKLDFKKLQYEFPDTIFLIRYHYLITQTNDIDYENVINVSDYSTISDLYLISDLLITDYSSVFFDYSILKKPFLFFTPDIDEYQDDLRGFYLDMYLDFPNIPAKTNDEVIAQMKELNLSNYQDFTKKYNPDKNKDCIVKILNIINENTF